MASPAKLPRWSHLRQRTGSDQRHGFGPPGSPDRAPAPHSNISNPSFLQAVPQGRAIKLGSVLTRKLVCPTWVGCPQSHRVVQDLQAKPSTVRRASTFWTVSTVGAAPAGTKVFHPGPHPRENVVPHALLVLPYIDIIGIPLDVPLESFR